jgi:hypothetical protein
MKSPYKNKLIELFEGEYPKRLGGLTDKMAKQIGTSMFHPEIKIIIDGRKAEL